MDYPEGFNWEHYNSYTMQNLADLFCLAILFVKLNMLASFILYFLANIEGYTPFVLGKFIGELFYMED